MIKKCRACQFFDCGIKCECSCHHGGANKIRQDHNASDIRMLQKTPEDQAMDGLAHLFG